MKVKLGDVCHKATSNIAQKDLEGRSGEYPVYGAAGFIANVDFYQQEAPYIAVIKDGAGVGRVMSLPGKSSVLGTLQYVIPNDDAIDLGYLAYAMEHMHLAKYFTGATIPHIYFKDYQKEELPLPPLSEQRRIAAVLDKVSDLIAKRRQQLKKLDELVKARFVEMFGDPMENPNGYRQVKLSEVATYFNGLTYKPESVATSGTIVLRSCNIQNNRLNFINIVRVNTPIRGKLIVKENDILMCSRNGSSKLVGKVALIKRTQEPMSFGAFMMIIRSRFYRYLMTYFGMEVFRRQIRTGETTTINQITGKMLDDVVIPLPPQPLIEKFTVVVERVEKQVIGVDNSLKRLKTLKKALMQAYFG